MYVKGLLLRLMGCRGGPVVKNLPASAGDVGSIPRWGRSPGEGNGNPLQYSCLENAMDRGAWWAQSMLLHTHPLTLTHTHNFS